MPRQSGQEIPTLISIDPLKGAQGQAGLHNRWHPDIPAVATVSPGDVFKIECHEWTGGQIQNTDSSADIRDVDLTQVHYLSGPIDVAGAEPGDVLVVDILDIATFPQMPWGFTGIFEKNNGGGLFAKEFNSTAAKAIWDLEGIYASSRHVPGVKFAGIPHPGLIGTAPSKELLDTWNTRECGLIDACKVDGKDPVPAVALPPNATGAYVGQNIDDSLRHKIYTEGCRTM